MVGPVVGVPPPMVGRVVGKYGGREDEGVGCRWQELRLRAGVPGQGPRGLGLLPRDDVDGVRALWRLMFVSRSLLDA